MRVLLVEDNALQREAVRTGLTSMGYVVEAIADGVEGANQILHHDFDLAILDIMLPGMSGIEILRRMREANRTTPVILLTARDGLEDRLEGFNHGADDYIPKPFAFAELLARIRALIRRQHGRPNPVLKVGNLTLDSVGHTIHHNGREIPMTPREFAVLEYLMFRAGSVVSRTELSEHVYEASSDSNSNALDVFISRLRRKLTIPGESCPIQTRRGHGYQCTVPTNRVPS
jgi:DNA-binding response OmpR family regulator